jgi:hypothetical protein
MEKLYHLLFSNFTEVSFLFPLCLEPPTHFFPIAGPDIPWLSLDFRVNSVNLEYFQPEGKPFCPC